MKKFESGAVRDTGGKGRMDLLPMCALIRVSKHMEDALTHYPERNWEKGLPMHTMVDSAFRHLAKYVDGWNDEDHLCAAATNLLMALWTEEKFPEMQDIPNRKPINKVDQDPDQIPLPLVNCDCYHVEYGKPVCWGTKECEQCTCGGDSSRCDFYEYKREKAKADREG